MSSGEGGFGYMLAEKFFGLILVIIGTLTAYYTFTSTSVLGTFIGFFVFFSFVLLILGLFMLIAKTEE